MPRPATTFPPLAVPNHDLGLSFHDAMHQITGT